MDERTRRWQRAPAVPRTTFEARLGQLDLDDFLDVDRLTVHRCRHVRPRAGGREQRQVVLRVDASFDRCAMHASVAADDEMVAKGILPQQGFIKQEEISLQKFYETTNGQRFLLHQPA